LKLAVKNGMESKTVWGTFEWLPRTINDGVERIKRKKIPCFTLKLQFGKSKSLRNRLD